MGLGSLRSKLCLPPEELQKLIAKARADEREDTPAVPIQRQVHLSADQQVALVERYRAGVLQRELAVEFGVDRATVMAIIRRHGAQRKRGLDEAEARLAALRYESGESLATIGNALGVDPATVRNHMLKLGVRMRDTQGRERS